MEPIPSVELLDIHCPERAGHAQEIKDISNELCVTFKSIVDLAKQAHDLRLQVENEQDGLEATKSEYLDLVGDENTAQSLGDLRRLENWHEVASQRIKDWRKDFRTPTGPDLPTAPQMETGIRVRDYVPSNAVPKALEDYKKTVARAADNLNATLRVATTTHYLKLEALRQNIQTNLSSGQDATVELAVEAEGYRSRLAELEGQATELAGLDKRISEGLEKTDNLIDRASESWANLRRARKSACTMVNQSMTSFFVKLRQNILTEDIDQLLDSLKIGTFFHEASLQKTRNELDRKFFVRSAIGHLQYPNSGEEPGESCETSANAQKIAQAAMDREKYDGIAHLAALWPGDGIEILRKQTGDDPVPFDNLTEGFKALAIKEISFAASQLPAVTDQPEDAVPTTAIFENLVPTLREQRASRQFIIASHDANVVVSGDMERVIVFPPEATEQPIEGTLFDAEIRAKAIALLEGGDRAFELRRRRYGDYG